jgi:hypothetical protein
VLSVKTKNESLIPRGGSTKLLLDAISTRLRGGSYAALFGKTDTKLLNGFKGPIPCEFAAHTNSIHHHSFFQTYSVAGDDFAKGGDEGAITDSGRELRNCQSFSR